ncbi:MAG: exodeoxyribonuclease VII small subunit [Paracoccaceae bacterium]|nr:exodeoxyribonuclease VII small subunit [Paracoccaceae bacterium]
MMEKPIKDMTFEEAMAALEQVVTRLERGDVPLEEAISLYENGAALKKHCADKLAAAEAKVEKIRVAEGIAISTELAEGL